MVNPKQHRQYLQTQIRTASKEQLILMLFDGVIRFCEQGKVALAKDKKDIETAHKALTRAQKIVLELLCSVDHEKGGEVAKNLASLHSFACNTLIEANIHQDSEKIESVQNIYRELRTGWAGAMDKVRAEGGEELESVDTAKIASEVAKKLPQRPRQVPVTAHAGAQSAAAAENRPRISIQG